MTSARKLKKRTAARIASKLVYAVAGNPNGGEVGLTVFESRRRVASIWMPPTQALQLCRQITEAATGRRDQ